MRNNQDRLGVQQNLNDPTPITEISKDNLGLNFIVPTDLVDLPSRGKFYPKNHPLHLKDTIEIRQMTAKEEDILTSKSLLKKGVALDKLIQSLVVDKSIDPDSLTSEDRNAIIISARITGYGPDYLTSVTCPSCSEKTKYKFNLLERLPKEEENEVEEVEFLEDGNFSFVLPKSKWKVVLRALTGNDEKTILRVSEVRKKSANDSLLLEQLKLMVVSLQDVTEKKVLEEVLQLMPASDSKYLRRVYSQVVTPIDMRQTFICSSCDNEADMEVPLNADFFWFK